MKKVIDKVIDNFLIDKLSIISLSVTPLMTTAMTVNLSLIIMCSISLSVRPSARLFVWLLRLHSPARDYGNLTPFP